MSVIVRKSIRYENGWKSVFFRTRDCIFTGAANTSLDETYAIHPIEIKPDEC